MTLPFDRPEALALNEARMNHVKKLGLIQPGMRVLDVGAGVGRLSEYLLNWGCEVVALEGREENVKEAKRRYPGLDIRVCAVDGNQPVPRHIDGIFDAVLFFGTFYHLKYPWDAMKWIQLASHAPLFLLSTVVLDTSMFCGLLTMNEPDNRDQALDGYGCRPSITYVRQTLIDALYKPRYDVPQPDHPDYQWTPQNDGQWKRDGKLLRRFFIADGDKKRAASKGIWFHESIGEAK